jgi:hypothetical protein
MEKNMDMRGKSLIEEIISSHRFYSHHRGSPRYDLLKVCYDLTSSSWKIEKPTGFHF